MKVKPLEFEGFRKSVLNYLSRLDRIVISQIKSPCYQHGHIAKKDGSMAHSLYYSAAYRASISLSVSAFSFIRYGGV